MPLNLWLIVKVLGLGWSSGPTLTLLNREGTANTQGHLMQDGDISADTLDKQGLWMGKSPLLGKI